MLPKLLRVLIVDDEPELRKSVRAILEASQTGLQWSFGEAGTGVEALNQLALQEYDLVLMDVRMPEMTGLEALVKIKARDPRTFVVIMTAHSNLQDAVAAIKEGAYDYIEKPVQPEQVVRIVGLVLEAREMVSNLAISSPVFDDDTDTEFVGTSSQMKKVFDVIHRVAKVDTTVLIRGENGTGKELVANAVHHNSPRKDGPFIAVNCGAIPENLLESEFFGHEKGAFTGADQRKIGKFQVANSGTLFLDEVAELNLSMQVKLLRVLQERKFMPVGSNREVKTSARIIAATNRNLEKLIEQGLFREDLYYRLNVMPIFLPPLRERSDDIPALVDYFIQKFNKKHGRQIQGIEPAALAVLKNFAWPGNIRELENVIEHAFIIENSTVLTLNGLPDYLRRIAGLQTGPSAAPNRSPAASNRPATSGGIPLDFDVFKEQTEKEFVIAALKANKGRINQTVAQANIPKNTLLRKIKKYGISPKDYEDK